MLLRFNFKTRIIAFNTLIAGLGILVLMVTGYLLARSDMNAAESVRLASARDLQKRGLETWWKRVSASLRAEASSPTTIQAIQQFRGAFEDLARDNGGREGATRLLQRVYIQNNSFEKHKKQMLNRGTGAAGYDSVHARYHRYYREFSKSNQYYDLFLIDSETGHIVYTVFKELDFGTNLLSGQWKDTHLGRVFREARAAKSENAVYATDFEAYAPSGDDPAYFKARPIFVNGQNVGVLALQYSQSHLDRFMHEVPGLGRTGATYLIGADGYFRSNSKALLSEGIRTLLNSAYPVHTEPAELALAGQSGSMYADNFQGNSVLSAYAPIQLDGNRYGLLVEIESAELNESILELLFHWSLISVGILLLVACGSYFMARRISEPVDDIVQTLTSSAREIAATVDQQESVAHQQSTSVSETTATMSNLGQTSKQAAEQAGQVAMGAGEAMTAAEEGRVMVDEMQSGMLGIKSRVGAIAEQISHLSEQTHQIGNITSFVSDLANQTNMLALNAAVEAVRAGEHGKGFAVVASEIRKLADQSKKSAERIQSLVGEIQHATDATVMATDEGTKSVNSSETIATRAAEAFQRVSGEMQRVVENTARISENVRQQAAAVGEVVYAMNEINTGARETATGALQTKQGVGQLNSAAEKLRALMAGGQEVRGRLLGRRASDLE